MQRKRIVKHRNNIVSKKGQLTLLRCSNVVDGGPFLDLTPIYSDLPKEAAFDYLANILVAIFLEDYAGQYEESGDLLPGLDKGTG
jgi:hypothetical protein